MLMLGLCSTHKASVNVCPHSFVEIHSFDMLRAAPL